MQQVVLFQSCFCSIIVVSSANQLGLDFVCDGSKHLHLLLQPVQVGHCSIIMMIINIIMLWHAATTVSVLMDFNRLSIADQALKLYQCLL